MAEIILVPKGKIGITVEAEVIRPDAVCRKVEGGDREDCRSGRGRASFLLSEFFDVDVRGRRRAPRRPRL